MKSYSPLRSPGLALALLLAGLPRVASAQPQPAAADRAEARRNFQSGVAAYARHDWAAALESFQSAYRVAPNPAVRVNIANCLSQLGRVVEALHHFEQFLAESPNAPAPQRDEIERHITELRARLGEVTVRVTPANAPELSPSIDGVAVIPAEAVRLAPGHHVLTVTAVGYTAGRREFDLVAGARDTLELTLSADAPPPPPPSGG